MFMFRDKSHNMYEASVTLFKTTASKRSPRLQSPSSLQDYSLYYSLQGYSLQLSLRLQPPAVSKTTASKQSPRLQPLLESPRLQSLILQSPRLQSPSILPRLQSLILQSTRLESPSSLQDHNL